MNEKYKRGPEPGNKPHPMTPERIAMFLKVYLESGGNFAEAARQCCPGAVSNTHQPCYSSFKFLKRNNLEFKAACEAVLDEVRDAITAEIDRRGRLGWLEPVFQKGIQATDSEGKPAFIRRFDSKLLLARARALMPETYGEKRQIEITHHKGSGGQMVVSGSDLAALSPGQKLALSDIMGTIRASREGGTKALTHQPGQTLGHAISGADPSCCVPRGAYQGGAGSNHRRLTSWRLQLRADQVMQAPMRTCQRRQ